MQVSFNIVTGESIDAFSDNGLKFKATRADTELWEVLTFDEDTDEDWVFAFVNGNFDTVFKAAREWFGL